MSVAVQIPKPVEQAEAVHEENRVVLYGIDWTSYTRFLKAGGTRRIRFTYDRGTLEIMTVSRTHEWWARRLGFLIVLLGAELGLEVQPSGMTTFRRRDRERGLEPDDCFHIRNFAKVAGPRNLDLRRDPPPDLAIEVDSSRSSLDRMAIYAALGVLEVWRCDREALIVYRLRDDGAYETCDRSLSFPTLPLVEFVQFIHQTQDLSHTGLIAPFQKWTREHAVPAGPRKKKRK